MAILPQHLMSKFWEMVNVHRPDECWEWKGRLDPRGYARIHISGWGDRMGSHIALEWKTGVERPPGLYACHSCDNPICVNPFHQTYVPGGKTHRKPHLTERERQVIREQYEAGEASKEELAVLWSVSRNTIFRLFRKGS